MKERKMHIIGLVAAILLIFESSGVNSGKTYKIGCDPGWLVYGSSCYYVNNQRKVTWSQALSECNRFDSSPIFFETPAELAFYKNVTAQYPSSAYWTSMNDITNNDQSAPGTTFWMWGSHEYIDTDVIKWSSSPANDGRAACGGLNINGKMYDADCNSKQGYACQIPNGVTQGGCPFGWLNTDTDCFYISNTTDPSQLKTWNQAKAQCSSMNQNAILFVIDDPTDQSTMLNNLPFLDQNAYLHWTGLQGTGQPGGWSWANGATFNQQLFTWALEPDGVAGVENCAVIRFNGKFSDRGCNMKQNYMCRKPAMDMDALSTFNLGCGLWTRAGQKCYEFYSSPRSTWSQSKQMCQAMGGDLLNVPDLDTKEWVLQQMLDPSNGFMFWTALNDRDNEGVYKWGDGSTLNTQTITWNQEPNNWQGNENCALIYPTGDYNDIRCSYHGIPLCEMENVPNCPGWVSRPSDSGSGLDCYMFGKYNSKNLTKSQQEAADYCRSLAIGGGNNGVSYIPHLLSVDSQAEATYINQQLANYQDNPYGFWTSLRDTVTDGFWVFSNNPGGTTQFVKWKGEPSTYTADTDCVGVSYGANFFVRKCGLKYPFICERPANTPWSSAAEYTCIQNTTLGTVLSNLVTKIVTSWETSFQDVSNDMSHDTIGQELNEIFQTVEFTSS